MIIIHDVDECKCGPGHSRVDKNCYPRSNRNAVQGMRSRATVDENTSVSTRKFGPPPKVVGGIARYRRVRVNLKITFSI